MFTGQMTLLLETQVSNFHRQQFVPQHNRLKLASQLDCPDQSA